MYVLEEKLNQSDNILLNTHQSVLIATKKPNKASMSSHLDARRDEAVDGMSLDPNRFRYRQPIGRVGTYPAL